MYNPYGRSLTVSKPGEKLNFVGEHYQFTKLQAFFNPGPISHPDIPVFCGAVGPDMMKMVGKIADGLITHPTNTAPRYLSEVCQPRLQAGFTVADRDTDDFVLMVSPLMAVGRDAASLRSQQEKQRALLGFLFSTPAYWPSLDLFGWQGVGEKLLAMTRDGQWDKMREIISDDMLNTFVPTGTYSEIASVLRERYGPLTRRITFPMPDDEKDGSLVKEVLSALKS